MSVRTRPGCIQALPHLYQARETCGLWNQPGVEPAPWGCRRPPVETVPKPGMPPVPPVDAGFLLLLVI